MNCKGLHTAALEGVLSDSLCMVAQNNAPSACGCIEIDPDNPGDLPPPPVEEPEDDPDNCPNDPNKTSPGSCGCGIPDTNSDDDGTPDCYDNCPSDSLKTEPGECGCGQDESTCSDQCVDRYPDCSVLVASGYCSLDAVNTGCCGCSDQCVDRYPDCSTLVATGYCSLDAVKTGCCGCQDTPPPNECADKSIHCSNWASQGECARHADYMSSNCCASCESHP